MTKKEKLYTKAMFKEFDRLTKRSSSLLICLRFFDDCRKTSI